MNACCTRFNVSPSATPSIVLIVVPAACAAGTRQLLTNSPSISTEHAPHSPSPHPSLTPVQPCSRNTSSRRAIGHASSCVDLPFKVKLMGCIHRLHQLLRDRGDLIDRDTQSIFNRIADRR